MRTGVQPCETAPQKLHRQRTVFQVHLVQAGDFQFAAFRRLNLFGKFDDAAVVEIKAGNRPVGFRLLRFFFKRQRLKVFIEFDHAEAFGVFDLIGEHGCAVISGSGFL